MKDFGVITQFCSTQLQDKFQKLSNSVASCFGLDVVIFTKISSDGSFFQMCSFCELVEYYWTTDLYLSNPFFHHPRSYGSGSLVITDCSSDEFHSSQNHLSKFYNSNQVMVNFIQHGNEAYWIGLSSKNKNLPLSSLFMKERQILEKYAHFLFKEWQPFFKKMDPFTIDIEKHIGRQKFREGLPVASETSEQKRYEFYRNIGLLDRHMPIPRFSRRENQCIYHLLRGKNATEIGHALGLSNRTVQSYIENIKSKLNCHKKSELIERVLALKDVGLLLSSSF